MSTILYQELINNRNTPFYIFDTKGFIDNYGALQDAMKAVYPNYRISYSYKTNYTPYICELVKRMGGYAEVVSDMEYILAKRLGYANSKIVYNGPAKGDYLEEHLLNGGIVNIDNLAEAVRIAEFAADHTDIYFKVGLRINMYLGGTFISRFGMEPESPELFESIRVLKSQSNIGIVGLHCHISRSRGLEAWAKRVEIMLKAADRYIEGIPEYISLGSGMFADMSDELKTQFVEVPTYKDYAKVTMQPFADHYKNKLPIVFTEPGTTVVARYISFVSTVLNIKSIRGRFMATMDGSYENLGEICTLKNLPVRSLKSNSGEYYDAIDLMGYTCLEQDLMHKGYKGTLAVGDVLMFENVGGYSIVSKPQFIKPNCAMIAVEEGGIVKEIMRQETFDDVFSKFTFAEA